MYPQGIKQRKSCRERDPSSVLRHNLIPVGSHRDTGYVKFDF